MSSLLTYQAIQKVNRNFSWWMAPEAFVAHFEVIYDALRVFSSFLALVDKILYIVSIDQTFKQKKNREFNSMLLNSRANGRQRTLNCILIATGSSFKLIISGSVWFLLLLTAYVHVYTENEIDEKTRARSNHELKSKWRQRKVSWRCDKMIF